MNKVGFCFFYSIYVTVLYEYWPLGCDFLFLFWQLYRRDCETFCTVVKMLVAKEPSLGNLLQSPLDQNLLEIKQRCLEDLRHFVKELHEVLEATSCWTLHLESLNLVFENEVPVLPTKTERWWDETNTLFSKNSNVNLSTLLQFEVVGSVWSIQSDGWEVTRSLVLLFAPND